MMPIECVLMFTSVIVVPVAVTSTVETHKEKSLRCMMSGTAITTQYSTVEFMASVVVWFLRGPIPIITPVQQKNKFIAVYHSDS